jgi:polar amino acid transport system substrate-binding protein
MTHSIVTRWAVAACCAAASQVMCEPAAVPSRLLTLPYPPYTIESGPQAPGALGELVLDMSKRVGLPNASVEFFPWARTQMMAQTQPHSVIFPIDRAEQRESSYRWLVRLYCREVGYVALRPFVGDLDHGDSLSPFRVGILRGSPSQDLLKSLKFSRIIEANDYAELAKMLQKNIVDVIYGTQDIGVYELMQAGFKSSDLKLSKPMLSRGVWLAANLAMPDAAVTQWKQAFEQANRDGTYNKILRKYQMAERSCQ